MNKYNISFVDGTLYNFYSRTSILNSTNPFIEGKNFENKPFRVNMNNVCFITLQEENWEWSEEDESWFTTE